MRISTAALEHSTAQLEEEIHSQNPEFLPPPALALVFPGP